MPDASPLPAAVAVARLTTDAAARAGSPICSPKASMLTPWRSRPRNRTAAGRSRSTSAKRPTRRPCARWSRSRPRRSSPARSTFDTLAPTDWVRKSLEGLKPVEAGRFVVHGSHDRARIAPNRIGIEIEAGLAFGTGHHGTTRGCLLALDRLMKGRCRRAACSMSAPAPACWRSPRPGRCIGRAGERHRPPRGAHRAGECTDQPRRIAHRGAARRRARRPPVPCTCAIRHRARGTGGRRAQRRATPQCAIPARLIRAFSRAVAPRRSDVAGQRADAAISAAGDCHGADIKHAARGQSSLHQAIKKRDGAPRVVHDVRRQGRLRSRYR